MKSRNLRTRQNVYGYILIGFSFLMLTFLTVKIFAPEINTDAESQKAEQIVGPYEMSMANDSVATVNITPTEEQSVYSVANDLTIKNTCDAGATITMTMTSSSSNSLTRAGADSGVKEIAATTTTELDNYSWGYALENSSTYYAVPKLGESVAMIYDETKAQTDELPVYVKFGVKTDNNLPSGTYTNDVIYTMTPKPGCLTYDVTWDFDGGTAKSGATYPTNLGWGDTVDLSQLTPTREGYTFAGWTNGSSTFSGSETAADLNPSNAKSVKVTAKWASQCASGATCETIDLTVNGTKLCSYSGVPKGVIFKNNGNYKIELWGAQGGGGGWDSGRTRAGGTGSYVSGTISISDLTPIYFYIGQKASDVPWDYQSTPSGGWNGGSVGGLDVSQRGTSVQDAGGGGGGATDVRYFGEYVPSTSEIAWNSNLGLRSRIMVASGGSGGGYTGWANGAGLSDGKTTQTSGSAFGWGVLGSTGGLLDRAPCGGGGGYWGGAHPSNGYGGANMSYSNVSTSYISGHTGAVAIISSSSTSPKSGCTTGTTNNACSIHYSGKTFYSTVMIDGSGYKWTNTKQGLELMPNPSGGYYASGVGHSGHGYARITYLGMSI